MLSTVLSFRILHNRTKIPVFRELNINGGIETKNSKLCAVLCLVAQSFLTLCTPWTVAHQPPLSMGFSRQKYWSGLPGSPPGDLPDRGIELMSLRSPTYLGFTFFLSASTQVRHQYPG